MFRRIDHVEIVPLDMDRTVDFYTRVLGFSVRRRTPGRAGSPWREIVYLGLGDTMLELLAGEAPPSPAVQAEGVRYRMMAIEVEDMDRAIDYLRGEGVEPTWGPVTIGTSRRAEIKDPSGLPVELRQW